MLILFYFFKGPDLYPVDLELSTRDKMRIVYIISITQLAPVNNITDILRLWLPNRLRVQPVIQYMLYDSRHTHQCNLDHISNRQTFICAVLLWFNFSS